METLQQELDTACRLAREAGAVIMRHYRGGFSVEYKDSHESDPVTRADRDANEVIVAGLRASFPDDGILAEESTDSSERLSRRRLWCVDPLDGTREFVDKNGMFVVMIGLAVEGRATLGVVYRPTEDMLWWGMPGEAAELRPSGRKVPLTVTELADPATSTLLVSRSHRSQTVTRVAEKIGVSQELPLGSVGLKVSRIACGAAEIYISVTDKTKEWDVCAPEAILAAAGGRMTDITGAPLRYNKETPNTPLGILASNGLLHDRCIEPLLPVARERFGWRAGGQ